MSKALLMEQGRIWFSRFGYTATGLGPLLAEAQIPKGSFYHFFASKEAFALEVLDMEQSVYLSDLQRTLLNPTYQLNRRIHDYLSDQADALVRNKFDSVSMVGTFSTEVRVLPKALRGRLMELRNEWDALLRQSLSGQIIHNPESFVRFFWNSLLGALQRAKLEVSIQPIDDFRIQILAILEESNA